MGESKETDAGEPNDSGEVRFVTVGEVRVYRCDYYDF